MQEIIHPMKMVTVILDEIWLGRNWFFTFSTLTFKQGQHATNDEINNFECTIYTFTMNLNSMSYIQFIHNTHCYAIMDYFALD